VASRVATSNPCRLIRPRGLARLSAWFAFGFVFSEVSGYTIEVQQQEAHWRTDVDPSIDFQLLSAEEVIGNTGGIRPDAPVTVWSLDMLRGVVRGFSDTSLVMEFSFRA
jgi:hypothetical protein